jgi:prepilin signal peptidase PulO-like enzyme (type II secretory pathway)
MAPSTLKWSLMHAADAPGAAAATVVLFGALAVASVTDLRSRRIPNIVTFPIAAVGVCLHALTGGGWAALSSAVALALWFIGGITFWSLSRGQGIGAGDVKMAMASGALWGFWPTFWLVFASNLLQVGYLFVRWLVQGTGGENFRRLGTWVYSIVSPGTKVVHFQPAGMEDKTPHAPFMLLGAALVLLLDKYERLPW